MDELKRRVADLYRKIGALDPSYLEDLKRTHPEVWQMLEDERLRESKAARRPKRKVKKEEPARSLEELMADLAERIVEVRDEGKAKRKKGG